MTVGLIIGFICAGIAIGMLLTPFIMLVGFRITKKFVDRETLHIQNETEEKFAEWLLEETDACGRCTHCYECNNPETYVEGAPLPPKEKCIEGIVAYTCREAGRKEKRR